MSFRIPVIRDGDPLPGASVSYSYGPEMLPPKVEKTAPVPKDGLVVAAGTMTEPGFLRLVATAEVDGKKFRGLATAGFSPEAIKPTVEDPPDFDAFWAASKDALAKLPIDAKLTLLPDLSTPKVDVYHVSLQNVGRGRDGHEPLLRHPGRAEGTGAVSRGAGRARRGRAAVPGPRRAGREGRDHAPGRHPRPAREPRPAGLRQPAGGAALPAIRPSTSTTAIATTTAACTSAACGRTTSWPPTRSGTARPSPSPGAARAARSRSSPPPSTRGSPGSRPTTRRSPIPRATRRAARAAGPTCSRTRPCTARPAKLSTIRYYDVVNFARRVKVPGLYSWGYNDETCPPTSMYSAWGVIPGPEEAAACPRDRPQHDPRADRPRGPLARHAAQDGQGRALSPGRDR